MTTYANARKNGNQTLWPCRLSGALGLAASPVFVLMAWISANGMSQTVSCSSASDVLHLGGMAWMYLLMSLFHVSPWLKLASGRERQTSPSIR
ncbi:hypothetical protein [Roseibium sp.]|uniref:hypothetical protein n=1 Tax=Roseibium sp. TaxID=1936156 RepID=UPI003D142B3A